MSKLAFTAALLLLAGCNASNSTAPTTSEPSFLNNTTGCAKAAQHTAGTPGAAKVAAACNRGQGQGQ
jgi:hypothetical protein